MTGLKTKSQHDQYRNYIREEASAEEGNCYWCTSVQNLSRLHQQDLRASFQAAHQVQHVGGGGECVNTQIATLVPAVHEYLCTPTAPSL